MILASKPEGSVDALRAMADRRDFTARLSALSLPVLAVAGAEDGLVTPGEMRAMSEKISGAEFHALPRSGHLVNLEQTGLFNEILSHFLCSKIRD